MNKKCVLILVFLLCIGCLNAARRRRATIQEACENAPIIVVAEIERHQYESMAEGETRRLDQYSLWNDYKIISVLKNSKKHEKIKKDKIIQIPFKSNVGIRSSIYVTRKKDNVQIKYFVGNDDYATKLKPISDYTKNLHNKVVLFLRAKYKPSVRRDTQCGNFIPKRSSPLFDTGRAIQPLSEGPKKPYDFFHYGWCLSPMGYSKENLRKIKSLINK